MKKHMEPILRLKKTELIEKAASLKTDIAEARRSVYAGEAQNHQMIGAKRRELARINTALVNAKDEAEVKKPAKPAKKETK